jgi:predicted nucleic acid-binding protein
MLIMVNTSLRSDKQRGFRRTPDNHIIACALAGNANLIVSQDLDLLRLKTYDGIGIISPIDFLNTLGLRKAA